MKTTIKCRNYEFFAIYLKHVAGPTSLANPTGTQKCWATAHENGNKHENDEFLVITLKHVSCLKVIVNHPKTPNMWAIAHENGHKTQKQQVFGQISQTSKCSYEACKSTWNPKTVGTNS